VRLEVSDTGIGLPAGIDIFEPFITTKAQGTGLGLTVVRQIVSAHKGTLTYHSVPGEGTTFTLMLPVSQDAEN
jgi:two-component system nitrogen regulation sensor histidine kinase NtrY